MALKNFTQFTPQTVLSATDFLVGYRNLDEIRTDLDSMSLGVSALLISKGFLPGTTLGSIKRKSFQYTIVPGNNLNAVSGTDDYGNILSYTVNQVEVYRNGSHLVNSQDYLANNSTQILNLSTLNFGDIVQVVGLSGIGVTQQNTLSGFLGNLVQTNFRYSVASSNTITPGSTVISGSDDYGAVLSFKTNAFEVYLNGSHLVRDYDYTSYNLGTSFTLASPVSNGDSVDVVSLSSVTTSQLSSISAFSGISKILAGDRTAISSSTGNVTVSSQTCISDILVPNWTNANHISQFSLLQDYLSAVAASNTSPANASYIEQHGSYPGGGAHNGGVLLPDGKVFCVPENSTVARIYNPASDSLTTPAGGYPGGNAHERGVLLADGRVFCVPDVSTVARIYNPQNDTLSTPGGSYPGSTAHSGGVLIPDGRVFCVPYNSTVARIYNPASDSLTTPAGGYPGGNAHVGGVLLPDGRVFCVPYNSTVARIYNPASNTLTTPSGGYPGSGAHNGGVLLPDGRVFCVPSSSTVARIYNPASDSLTTPAGGYPGSSDHSGGVLLPNGMVFCVPHNSTVARIYNPATNTLTTPAGGYPGSLAHSGGVLLADGRVFCVPYNSTVARIVIFLNNNNFNINVCTNPFFNKL